ncbi:MAG TPA: hypothetical protein PK683_18835, partial [Leptospiraceae bacterium]|nr:hypothetical protein [Leptospiraceae bacterium]
FSQGGFFVRVDVLIKKDNHVELIEVKAKSYNPSEDEFFDKRLLKKGVHSSFYPKKDKLWKRMESVISKLRQRFQF